MLSLNVLDLKRKDFSSPPLFPPNGEDPSASTGRAATFQFFVPNLRPDAVTHAQWSDAAAR